MCKRTAWLKQEIATLLATQISTWNGITGGGTLDGGLTLTADLADWGEAQAGTSASKVMSALRVKQVVDAAIDALVGAAPAQMDTLNELAAAITENGDTSSALTALIASKLDAATYTPQDILAKLLGVDGTGSGLDADKLDGLQATSFFRADQSGALTNLGGSKQIFQGWAGDGSRWFWRLGNQTTPIGIGISNLAFPAKMIGGTAIQISLSKATRPGTQATTAQALG
jgi:hypothetical protein